MAPRVNRRWLLACRPDGMVGEEHFRWAEAPVPEVAENGQVLVEVLYLSCDPTQRGWMAFDGYMPAVELGEVMRSFGIGRVLASRDPRYGPGDLVQGLLGWQSHALVDARSAHLTPVPPEVPIPLAMSALGVTGQTAYFGLLDVGRPEPGQTVVVSGAAGATGSVAGQIARIKGCRAIGIAGGADKCRWLTEEARFDAAIDYRSEDVFERLGELCPSGLDVFFDNVGGGMLEAALAHLAMRARVVICGAIADYNRSRPPRGPRNYLNLLLKRGRMEGFLVLDYASRAGEAVQDLARWVETGEIRYQVDVVEGLENAPRALRRLFTGENIGKQLVRVQAP